MVEIKRKIQLKEKGDYATLQANKLTSTLSWKSAVDLDLHAFYKRKDGHTGHCYFGNKRDMGISLSSDEGIGDIGGDNSETITVSDISNFSEILIAANIYHKPNANFSRYDGKVTVLCGREEIEVPLTSSVIGSWCIIAKLDNNAIVGPQLFNMNITQRSVPHLGVQNDDKSTSFVGGFIRRIFG